MIPFAIAATLMLAAAVAALAFALRGGGRDVTGQLRQLLLDRARGLLSQEDFERRQAEAHAHLLAPAPGFRKGQLVALAAFAVGAVALYAWLGSPQAVDGPLPVPAMQADAGGQPGHSGIDMNEAVARLAEKLEKTPEDGNGWILLARSYVEMRRYPDAAAAFGRAAKAMPGDAAVLADYADAQVMANNRRWTADAVKAIQQALAADPINAKALALAGTEAFERADYRAAVAYWERLAKGTRPGSPEAAEVAANIQEARTLMAGGVSPSPGAAEPTAPAAGNGAISGSVDLAPSLRTARPDTTVFVFAKAPDSPGPPLAVLRLQVKDLPAKFRLDDSLAMMPGRNVSAFPEVLVQARLSASGNAMPQPGDAASETLRTKVGTEGLKLEIR